MTTSTYEIGALANLISTPAEQDSPHLGSFFTSRLPPEEAKPPQASPGAKAAVGKKGKKVIIEDEDEETLYSSPSLRFRVKMEESKERVLDPEKEARTVFVGNLPGQINLKALKRLFRSFGQVESVRLRGAARPDLKTTKKLAVIKRKFHEQHQRITAYVRFTDADSAVKSCQLNGSDSLGCIIRVNMATSKGQELHDNHKAIFVGNLPFAVEDDDVIGHFKDCGSIVDVRIVRDSGTGMGKGFCYVNFSSKDAVEVALRKDGLDFSGRKLRVTRCVKNPKARVQVQTAVKAKGPFTPKNQAAVKDVKFKKLDKKKLRQIKSVASFQGETADGPKAEPRKGNRLDKKALKMKRVAKQLSSGGGNKKKQKIKK